MARIPTIRLIRLLMLSLCLTALGCQMIQRKEAIQAAATAPATLPQADGQLTIDAYLWPGSDANEAQGHLWAEVVVMMDGKTPPIRDRYRPVEYQVIRTGLGTSIGQYPLAANDGHVQMMDGHARFNLLRCRLRHDLMTTGLSRGYDIVVLLERIDNGERLMLRTKNQPVHHIPPTADWFDKSQ